MTDVQQAVPVAQEDRNFAADYGIRFGRFGELYRRAIEDGQWDHTDDVQLVARHRLASLPCKSGEGADHGLGPHATVVDDCEDGFMSVAIVVGENAYLAQGGEQITMSREQFAQIAKSAPDATQTREAELVAALSTALGNLMNCRIDAETGVSKAQRVDALLSAEKHARAALNARGGA